MAVALEPRIFWAEKDGNVTWWQEMAGQSLGEWYWRQLAPVTPSQLRTRADIEAEHGPLVGPLSLEPQQEIGHVEVFPDGGIGRRILGSGSTFSVGRTYVPVSVPSAALEEVTANLERAALQGEEGR